MTHFQTNETYESAADIPKEDISKIRNVILGNQYTVVYQTSNGNIAAHGFPTRQKFGGIPRMAYSKPNNISIDDIRSDLDTMLAGRPEYIIISEFYNRSWRRYYYSVKR